MLEEILIAGFGGQGIMLMGQLLAYGAIYAGLEVTFFPAYGPEMRGGTANCTVVISDRRIGSPVRGTFTALVAMNPASLARFTDQVKSGGLITYNQSLIESGPDRSDVTVVEIPANRLALELGNPQVANMVAIGGLVTALPRISPETLVRGLARVLPPHRHPLIPINTQAIRLGFQTVAGGTTRKPSTA
ncbi:MAG: 2-oxoacid:acceptor oxidoreductase family protein [Desulfobacterales bacterium]|nr:2-oxoacid:acceptor oxidoreductase family protein [Desulfobacterales bacterium]